MVRLRELSPVLKSNAMYLPGCFLRNVRTRRMRAGKITAKINYPAEVYANKSSTRVTWFSVRDTKSRLREIVWNRYKWDGGKRCRSSLCDTKLIAYRCTDAAIGVVENRVRRCNYKVFDRQMPHVAHPVHDDATLCMNFNFLQLW